MRSPMFTVRVIVHRLVRKSHSLVWWSARRPFRPFFVLGSARRLKSSAHLRMSTSPSTQRTLPLCTTRSALALSSLLYDHFVSRQSPRMHMTSFLFVLMTS